MALQWHWRLGVVLVAAATCACLDLSANHWTFAGIDAGEPPDSGPGFVPATHLPWPQLVNDGGSVLAHTELVTVATQGDLLAPNFFAFMDTVVTDPWLATVGAEYGVGAATSGGSYLGPPLEPDGGVAVTWSQLQAYVAGVIDAGAPPPNGQSVYVVFLPPGAKINGASPSAEWSSFALPGQVAEGDMLLAILRATPLSGESAFDAVTVDATQHIVGLATDPWPPLGPAWFLPEGSPPWEGDPAAADESIDIRAGELCRDTRIAVAADGGPYAFARSWSNAAASQGGDPCLPAVSSPYYNVSYPQAWFAVDAGQAFTLPVNGWSTASVPDWMVTAEVFAVDGGFAGLTTAGLTFTTAQGPEQVGNCPPMPGMNNGVSGSVQFTVPATIASGDTAVLRIFSVYLDATLCSDAPLSAGDPKHESFVGLYAP
jgi:hypothetical protein